MKTQYIKLGQSFSFMAIILPAKILLPNGIILLLGFFQAVWSLFNEIFNQEMGIYSAFIIFATIGLIFIMSRFKFLNIFGLLFQFIYLCYVYKKGDINNALYLITISFYVLISSVLIFQLYFYKKKGSPL